MTQQKIRTSSYSNKEHQPKSLLHSKNLSLEIAEILNERIVKMDLKPGDRILEAKVSKELGVSQSSLREALRVLEQNGLVEINPRRGTYVTAITEPDIVVLYDILTELYELLARKALTVRTDGDVQQMVKLFETMKTAAAQNDVDGYYSGMFNFALYALEVIKSPLFVKIIQDLWPSKRRIEYITLSARKNDLSSSMSLFSSIQTHMVENDLEALVTAIRAFIQEEKTYALAHLSKNGYFDSENLSPFPSP